MSEPFLGEIKIVGFNFAPRGWAACEGQLIAIAQYQALYSLLGTMYGGDGRVSFGLPDLRGRCAIHHGQGPGLSPHNQGTKGGHEEFTLNANQLPSHSHTATLFGEPSQTLQQDMQGRLLGAFEGYTDPQPNDANRAMHADSVKLANSGANQAVPHRGPFIALNFIIALQGVFPSRS